LCGPSRLFSHCCPAAHAEWRQLLVDRAQLVEEWQRASTDLAGILREQSVEDKPSEELLASNHHIDLYVKVAQVHS